MKKSEEKRGKACKAILARCLFPLALLVVFAGGGGLWLWAYRAAEADKAQEMLTALGDAGLTLAAGGVLGGLVKLIFDRQARLRAEHEAKQVFYRNILDDLKSIYDEVERSRMLIEAHQSARTYGEQMRKMPDAIIKVRNIKRALIPEFKDLEKQLSPHLGGLTRFLDGLLDEYRDRYISISRKQSQDEATNRLMRTLIAQGDAARAPNLSTAAWTEIRTLPGLMTLRFARVSEKADDVFSVMYRKRFLDHIDAASRILRTRLDGRE